MKKYDVKRCSILKKEELSKGIYSFWVNVGELAEQICPGQFVNILVPSKTLRRPISICDIDAENKKIRLVFEIRGEGTEILAGYQEGDKFDLLLPLGNGFEITDCDKKALFIGGGIGVPPLLGAAKQYGCNATAIIGFRNREAVILEEDFRNYGSDVIVATDDGSYGHHGLVTDCLEGIDTDIIFACGPMPMLRAVAEYAREHKIACQISLEERMACGVGACLGCAVKLYREDQSEYYGHVCKDGPVFNYQKVVL